MRVYGKNVAQAIFERPVLFSKLQKIYIVPDFERKNKNFLPEKLKNLIQVIEKREMDRLAEGLHQGIMLDMEDYHYHNFYELLRKEPNFIVLLDHLEDPHNLGAIIRTCSAAGVDAIILPHNRQVGVSPTVMKTSAGTLFDVAICEVTNLRNTIETLKKEGFWIVGSAMEGTCYTTIDYHGKIALVIGNEGKGMGSLVHSCCDYIASIPMVGTLDSLNASVAAGILIYEVVRNRK